MNAKITDLNPGQKFRTLLTERYGEVIYVHRVAGVSTALVDLEQLGKRYVTERKNVHPNLRVVVVV